MKQLSVEDDITIGVKVKVVTDEMSEYRQKELKQFIGKVGTVVAIDVGYQSPEMYTVVFETKPLLFKAFFEYEVNLENLKEGN